MKTQFTLAVAALAIAVFGLLPSIGQAADQQKAAECCQQQAACCQQGAACCE
jgi:hypothetical protein